MAAAAIGGAVGPGSIVASHAIKVGVASEKRHAGDSMIEVFSILEQRQQVAETQEDALLMANNIDEIQNDGYSWVGGNPDGDVTMVEFVDYKCGYCRKAHQEVANLVKSDGNIKLVVKEYPILGEDSYNLSRAAIATLSREA